MCVCQIDDVCAGVRVCTSVLYTPCVVWWYVPCGGVHTCKWCGASRRALHCVGDRR